MHTNMMSGEKPQRRLKIASRTMKKEEERKLEKESHGGLNILRVLIQFEIDISNQTCKICVVPNNNKDVKMTEVLTI